MPVALSDLYPEFTNMLIQTYFFKVYNIYAPTDYTGLTTIVPSTRDAEVYPTLGPVAKMVPLTDEVQFGSLGGKQSFMVWNQKYVTAVSWDRTVWADDQYGILSQQIGQLAVEGKRKPADLVYTSIHNGAQTSGSNYNPGFDGQPLFSASHPGYSGTQTNILSQTLSASALQAGIAAMRNFQDPQGRPMDFVPDTLVVPPALEFTAKQLCHAAFFMAVGPGSGGPSTATTNIPTSNEFKGIINNVIVTPYLTSTTEWYLADTSGNRGVKPMILQEREAPKLTLKMDENTSDLVLRTDKQFARLYARWGCAPGAWQTIVQGSA